MVKKIGNMTMRTIQKHLIAPLAVSFVSASTLAQNTDQTVHPETWDISALTRINTKLGDDGSCQQILPNFIGTAKSDDWTFTGALQLQNLGAQNGCFEDHDTRLFLLTGTYAGLKDQGTAIDFGLFAPFTLPKSPLVKGFTPVVLDNAHQLYGGIAGIKINQALISTSDTTLIIDGMIGTKPEDFERFGPTADTVTAVGMNLKHQFNERVSIDTGARFIDFEDDINPSGSDIFMHGAIKYDGDRTDFEIYGEMTKGERSNTITSIDTDRYSLLGRATFDLAPKTQWEFAAGTINGDTGAETSLYHNFGSGFRGTVGYGHNLETQDHTARIGLIKTF